MDYEGSVKQVRSVEAIADTSEMTLAFLGDVFPDLQKLRLNNSLIVSIRDISSSLTNLRFLSLAHCGISSLDGICTLSPKIEELYLAFNRINNLSELMAMEMLTVLDLEENEITRIDEVGFLRSCTALRALTLAGNPVSDKDSYRSCVRTLLPELLYLDEKRLKLKVRMSSLDTAKSQISDENIFTEQLEDMENQRPPTARAYGQSRMKTPTKKIFTPKISRPVSSCKKVRPQQDLYEQTVMRPYHN